MPDDRDTAFERRPYGWGEAFAALPLETPDADAWPRLQRALSRPRRARWPLWLAAAAVLAVAAVVPWRLANDDAQRAERSQPVVQAHTDHADVATAPSLPAESAAAGDATREAAPSADAQDRLADAADAPASTQTPAPDAAASELERLYAESARLEALVAMARDERVATGTAAALASRYDAQVAEIDARLIELGTNQPEIAREERVRLWRERVDALHGLASFESTQRLLAARGERYDTMLVSVD